MEKKNLVLIGFMGSGKSSVAGKLSQTLKRKVISSDQWIIKHEQSPIVDIFKNKGEAYFRELEKKAIGEISQMNGVIVDCGGGIVLNQENIDLLKKNGVLIYLAAAPEFLYTQIKKSKDRPLLNVDNPLREIRALLEQRKDKYEQADIRIETTDHSIDWITQEILKTIK